MGVNAVREQREYSSIVGSVAGTVGRILLSLPLYTVNILVSLCKETTEERIYRHENGPCYERYVLLTLGAPVLTCLVVALLAPALIGLALYLCTYRCRRKVCFAVYDNSDINTSTHRTVGLATLNTQLTPAFIAKYSNLSKTWKRAKSIADAIPYVATGIGDTELQYNADILDFLPSTQVLCLQGVFDRHAASILANGNS